jgi:fatty acid desaturase
MDADVEKPQHDPDTELRWERVRMARARRRLVEHELTQRRVLLALTLALALIAIVAALIGHPSLGGVFGGVALAPGAAALSRRSSR